MGLVSSKLYPKAQASNLNLRSVEQDSVVDDFEASAIYKTTGMYGSIDQELSLELAMRYLGAAAAAPSPPASRERNYWINRLTAANKDIDLLVKKASASGKLKDLATEHDIARAYALSADDFVKSLYALIKKLQKSGPLAGDEEIKTAVEETIENLDEYDTQTSRVSDFQSKPGFAEFVDIVGTSVTAGVSFNSAALKHEELGSKDAVKPSDYMSVIGKAANLGFLVWKINYKADHFAAPIDILFNVKKYIKITKLLLQRLGREVTPESTVEAEIEKKIHPMGDSEGTDSVSEQNGDASSAAPASSASREDAQSALDRQVPGSSHADAQSESVPNVSATSDSEVPSAVVIEEVMTNYSVFATPRAPLKLRSEYADSFVKQRKKYDQETSDLMARPEMRYVQESDEFSKEHKRLLERMRAASDSLIKALRSFERLSTSDLKATYEVLATANEDLESFVKVMKTYADKPRLPETIEQTSSLITLSSGLLTLCFDIGDLIGKGLAAAQEGAVTEESTTPLSTTMGSPGDPSTDDATSHALDIAKNVTGILFVMASWTMALSKGTIKFKETKGDIYRSVNLAHVRIKAMISALKNAEKKDD